MTALRAQIKRLRDAYSLDELIILGLVLSVFLSIYVTVACLVSALVYLLLKSKLLPILNQTPKAYYLIAFSVLTLLVSVFSQNEKGIMSAFLIAAFLLIALFIRNTMTARLFEAALAVSCAASLISVAVIIVQLLISPGGIEIRPTSTFLNANYYGTIVEMNALFCIYKFNRSDSRGKLVYLLILAANLAGLYMSNSRTAMLALGLSVLFYFLINRQRRALFIAAGACLAVSAAFVLLPGMLDRITAIGTDLPLRVSIWRSAVRGIADSLIFGHGAGSYILSCIRFGGPIHYHAHNMFLEVMLNFGIAGTGLLAVYLRDNIRGIISLRNEPDTEPVQFLAHSVIFCLIIHGLTDVTLNSIQTALLFVLVLGAAGIREHAARQLPVVRPVPAIRLKRRLDRQF